MKHPVARFVVFLPALVLLLPSCIKLDFLFFEPEKADSVEGDYHGLPLTLAADPPDWIANAEVERELYLETPSGKALTVSETKNASAYLHGAFLHAPVDCPAAECPLSGQNITFLYQHGNSGHLFRYWYRAAALWSMGANVFIYTYRGYGLSSGEASRENVLEDATAAMAYLKNREEVDSSRIIAYGYSMGGIPTSYLVGRSDSKNDFFACVLESALDSPDSTLSLSTGTEFPNGFFMDAALFNGPAFIADAPSIPILHIHGGADERVVPLQAEQYYNVLNDRENYTHYIGKEDNGQEDWLNEAGHRNVPIVSFKGEFHIPDYFDDAKNPSHCCIHPIEYADPIHAAFLDTVGKTDGEEMQNDALRYRTLVADWVLSAL